LVFAPEKSDFLMNTAMALESQLMKKLHLAGYLAGMSVWSFTVTFAGFPHAGEVRSRV